MADTIKIMYRKSILLESDFISLSLFLVISLVIKLKCFCLLLFNTMNLNKFYKINHIPIVKQIYNKNNII